jgi:hypothetical protein
MMLPAFGDELRQHGQHRRREKCRGDCKVLRAHCCFLRVMQFTGRIYTGKPI